LTYREMEIPCYNCNERHIGCHGECDRYASYSAMRKQENERIFKEKEVKAASVNLVRKQARKVGKHLKNIGF